MQQQCILKERAIDPNTNDVLSNRHPTRGNYEKQSSFVSSKIIL